MLQSKYMYKKKKNKKITYCCYVTVDILTITTEKMKQDESERERN